MAIDVSAESVIRRSPAEVAAFALAPENEPRWISGIRSARLLTEPPVGVGTEVARVAGFLGRRIEYVLRVVDFDSAHRVVMDTVRGPFPMRVTYTFADSDGQTLARLRVEGEAGGFYRAAEPLLAASVRRSLTKDLRNLKNLLENGRG